MDCMFDYINLKRSHRERSTFEYIYVTGTHAAIGLLSLTYCVKYEWKKWAILRQHFTIVLVNSLSPV